MITCFDENNYTAYIDILTGKDERLAAVTGRFGYPPFFERPKGYKGLVRIILEQQVSLASAYAVFKKLDAGVQRITPEHIQALSPDQIQAFGVTRQKTAYIKHLADEIMTGNLDLNMLETLSDKDAVKTLTAVKGIGPWTADIYLLMGLKRVDIFPAGDLALRQAMAQLNFCTADHEQAKAAAQEYAPYRSLFAFLLWHWYLRTKKIRPPK